MAQRPIFKHLKNKDDFENIYKLSETNKSFKLGLNNNTRNRIYNPINNIKKGLVLLSVLTMAKMYDFRTLYRFQRPQLFRLGDDETMKYIEKLGIALINHIGKLGAMVVANNSQALEVSFQKHNEQLSDAFVTDFAFVMEKYATYKGNYSFKHHKPKWTPFRETQVSGLALYQYLYKYKNVYKQYMNSIGKLKFLNSNNNNLKREFTLKKKYLADAYEFSNFNLNSMLVKLNMPVLGNASISDPVASMKALMPYRGLEHGVEGVLEPPNQPNGHIGINRGYNRNNNNNNHQRSNVPSNVPLNVRFNTPLPKFQNTVNRNRLTNDMKRRYGNNIMFPRTGKLV